MSLDIATSTSNAALAPVSAPDILSAVAGRPDVSRQDVASLHRHLFAEGSIDRAEAEALFDLERAALSRCDAWTNFFIQAVTDHVVWGARPTGRLDDAQADWLIAQVDTARTPAAFALLVNVLDEAQTVPSWFAGAVRARAVAGWPGLSRGEDAFSRPLRLAA
ncbi:hypothetical protein D3273_23525 [Lichenibacterium minor]|uniref:Uncharacterized protein n=1 Tax=Lichenibacterium minor TaxID=2316528 RepID=A0A4Q2U1E1_9HYPH|nr:hypothetical protein [Lichenibacterium minor]RYC29508.1 hypothetical protein D3273_23525 [Lichenibacterium minor]